MRAARPMTLPLFSFIWWGTKRFPRCAPGWLNTSPPRASRTERKLPEGPVAEEVRSVLAGEYEGDFGDLCTRAAIIGRRLGPRWDQLAAELEGCARSWYAGTLW